MVIDVYGEVNTAILEKLVEDENELGEITEEWQEKETFPARLSRLSADRRYESNRVTGIVEWRLYLDYDKVSTNIKREDHRIKYNGKIYQIESVNNVDKLNKRYQIDLIRTD